MKIELLIRNSGAPATPSTKPKYFQREKKNEINLISHEESEIKLTFNKTKTLD